MKTYFLIIIMAVLLASCTDSEKRSDAYGNFETDEIIVSAESAGKLILLNIAEGQLLKKGYLAGMVDTTMLVIQRKQLNAQSRAISTKLQNIVSQIEVQQQQKKNLMVDKNRVENLLKDGAATQKQLDDINGKLDLIDVQIASIQTQKSTVYSEKEVVLTQIEQVEESLSKCSIVNPVNGTVLQKLAEENEITAPGKPLYKIANLDYLFLRVYADGSQLPHIKIGQEVEVVIDESVKENKTLSGNVSWISESAEFTPKIIQTKEERVNMVYAIKIKVKNDGSLKIGMPGEVNF
jgi:HlyD family secretion protein